LERAVVVASGWGNLSVRDMFAASSKMRWL